MTFIIACGGTAGHINPGLAIADELCGRIPGAKVLFIGSGRDLEKRLVPEAGFELINIKMTGIRRGIKPGDIAYNIRTLVNIISARRAASKIIKQMQPDAVIGTGGYICYPVLKAAARQNIPTFILESNAKPGMTVKRLSKSADKVLITYPGYDMYYKRPERVVITGTPLRKSFTAIGRNNENTVRQDLYKFGEKPLVVTFWGSLGAGKMNAMMAEFIKRNIAEQSFFHIHAVGDSGDMLTQALEEQNVKETGPPYADIRRYIDNMPSVMGAADLIVCRAGAATISEITAMSKPSILIPSPYVPDNVQQINAKQLELCGAAVVINEFECNGDLLYDTVCEILKDKAKLSKMREASKTLAKPEAAKDIADLILSHIRGH